MDVNEVLAMLHNVPESMRGKTLVFFNSKQKSIVRKDVSQLNVQGDSIIILTEDYEEYPEQYPETD